MRDYNYDPITVKTNYTFEQQSIFRRIHFKTQFRMARIIIIFIYIYMIIRSYFETQNMAQPVMLFHGLINLYFTVSLLCNTMFFLVFFSILSGGLFMKYAGKKFFDRQQRMYGNRHYEHGDLSVFSSNCFVSQTETSKIIVKYQDLVMVTETGDMFYLYEKKYHAYLVDKIGIQNGTADELRALLLKHIDQKTYRYFNGF